MSASTTSSSSSGEAAAGLPDRRVPGYLVLGLLLLVGLALLPLPGIDQDAALRQLGRSSQWWTSVAIPWPPAFSPLSTGLLGLVIGRLALGLLTVPGQDPVVRRLWQAITLGLYLGGTFASGVALGLTLDLRYPDLIVVGDQVVLAGLAGVSCTAAAAALWSIAELIARSGLVSGALALFGAWEAVRIVRFMVEAVLELAAGGGPELGAAWMPLHAGLLPVGMICLSLWRRTPDRGPVRVMRNMWLRGPFDLLVLPLVAGAIAATISADIAGIPQWTPQPPLYDQGLLARSMVSLLVVPTIAAWAERRPGTPGSVGWGIAGFVLLGGTAVWLAGSLWWEG